jgi:hypothetical protein
VGSSPRSPRKKNSGGEASLGGGTKDAHLAILNMQEMVMHGLFGASYNAHEIILVPRGIYMYV